METTSGRNEFAQILRYLILSGGDFMYAAEMAKNDRTACSRVVETLARAVDAGSLEDPDFNATLGSLKTSLDFFWASIRQQSVFEYLRQGIAKEVPVRRVGSAITVQAAASAPGEANLIPVGGFTISPVRLTREEVVALVIANEELVRLTGDRVIADELRKAVIQATDVSFLAALATDTSVPAVTGTANPLTDLGAAVEALAPKVGEKVIAVIPTALMAALAWKPSATNAAEPAYPGVSATAISELQGLILFPSDALVNSPEDVLVFKGNDIALESTTPTVHASRHASVDLAGDDSNWKSLWAENALGVKVHRSIGAAPVRDGAIVLINNPTW